jgi:leader peptidase (prepilin peptidase)/N-methyltransferase
LVPVLAWPLLRGRSLCCGKPLRPRYIAVEIIALAGAIWAVVATDGWITITSLGLLWIMIWLSLVDFDSFRLPDWGTLPLILAGLTLALLGLTDTPLWHALGAAAGYVFVYGLRAVWHRLRGVEAIGLGDAKLLAAAGAWCGLAGLPSVLLWACVAGLAIGILSGMRQGALHSRLAVPFGPALALGFWITWLEGPVVV